MRSPKITARNILLFKHAWKALMQSQLNWSALARRHNHFFFLSSNDRITLDMWNYLHKSWCKAGVSNDFFGLYFFSTGFYNKIQYLISFAKYCYEVFAKELFPIKQKRWNLSAAITLDKADSYRTEFLPCILLLENSFACRLGFLIWLLPFKSNESVILQGLHFSVRLWFPVQTPDQWQFLNALMSFFCCTIFPITWYSCSDFVLPFNSFWRLCIFARSLAESTLSLRNVFTWATTNVLSKAETFRALPTGCWDKLSTNPIFLPFNIVCRISEHTRPQTVLNDNVQFWLRHS